MEELVKRAKKGDADAFNEIIPQVKRRMYIIAKSKLYNEEDVLDIMQITFTKAFKYLKQLKDESKFTSWITSILINSCNTFLKRSLKSEKTLYDINDLDSYYSENTYIEVDKEIDFFMLIKMLSEDEKVLVSMYYSEEYTTKEISEILGISENTIRSKIRRAKLKIIDRYKKGGLNWRKI